MIWDVFLLVRCFMYFCIDFWSFLSMFLEIYFGSLFELMDVSRVNFFSIFGSNIFFDFFMIMFVWSKFFLVISSFFLMFDVVYIFSYSFI